MSNITPKSYGLIAVLVAGTLLVAACGDGSGPPQPGSLEVLAGADQSAAAGTTVPIPPSVRLRTIDGKPLRGAQVTFSASGGIVTPTETVTDAQGIAALSSWTLPEHAGSHQLTVSSAGVTPVIFTAEAVPGKASQLAVVTQPASTLGADTAFRVQSVVEIQDAFGNRVSSSLPVTAGLAPGSSQTLTGTLTVQAVDGRAEFTDLVVIGTGSLQLRFTASGLADATSATFNVAGNECAGAIRALDFALGESNRYLASQPEAPFCFDFAQAANAGQQYLVQIENMSMTGNSDTGVFPGTAMLQTGLTVSVTTGAAPAANGSFATPRPQLPEGAVHSWDFGAGRIFEIEAREPLAGINPAVVARGDVMLDVTASGTELTAGDTIVVHMVGIPRLGIEDGQQQAVVRYVTPDLVIAEDVRLATLARQNGGVNTPLSSTDMQAIAADYARYAKVQADRFFDGRYNTAIEASGGRPIAIHSLTYADNFPNSNYFVWDFWVGTNGSVKGPNQQIERNANNLFMHEVSHMRHYGLVERANASWRANRWLVEGFARATERWPIAMRLLGAVAPSRTGNLVLPLYPVSSLNMLEDVPAYTQASSSLYGGYAASSYVFDYFADQVARRGGDWRLALSQFVVNAGTEDALDGIVDRYLPGLDAGTLFTQARIALFTDDYAAGLPAWTQYHQFDLRASRTTANPQLDPRNLYLQIRPGEVFSDARVVLPGGAYGYIIDGTSATGSARVLFNLPRASYGVLSVTRIR